MFFMVMAVFPIKIAMFAIVIRKIPIVIAKVPMKMAKIPIIIEEIPIDIAKHPIIIRMFGIVIAKVLYGNRFATIGKLQFQNRESLCESIVRMILGNKYAR